MEHWGQLRGIFMYIYEQRITKTNSKVAWFIHYDLKQQWNKY